MPDVGGFSHPTARSHTANQACD